MNKAVPKPFCRTKQQLLNSPKKKKTLPVKKQKKEQEGVQQMGRHQQKLDLKIVKPMWDKMNRQRPEIFKIHRAGGNCQDAQTSWQKPCEM